MKALLSAPQTAMRHHSQRGPTEGKAAQHSKRGEERIPRKSEREKSAQTEIFYLEGLESDFLTLNLLEFIPCPVY